MSLRRKVPAVNQHCPPGSQRPSTRAAAKRLESGARGAPKRLDVQGCAQPFCQMRSPLNRIIVGDEFKFMHANEEIGIRRSRK
jgi:hypothetical protein